MTTRSTMPGLPGWAVALVAMTCAPCPGEAQDTGALTLPATIAIFPLPDVTLFPSSTQPFHIFEPRYRAMVTDALEGDSIIGMVTLRPGYEADYEGRPPVYAIGAAGVIIASEELADGRYDIVLRGFAKFRILSEDPGRPYRLAEVEELPEVVAESDRPLLAQRREQIEQAFRAAYPDARPPRSDLSDEEVIDGLSLILPIEPRQRMELLEADGPAERASGLLRLLRGGRRAAP